MDLVKASIERPVGDGNFVSMGQLLLEKECYEIIGLCMEVHRVLGPGFSEVIYKDALEIELIDHNIPYHREKPYNVLYKERRLKRRYNADFVVYDSLLLEAKAVESIIEDFVTVTINYLKAADLEVGLIVNLGERSLKYRRVIFTL